MGDCIQSPNPLIPAGSLSFDLFVDFDAAFDQFRGRLDARGNTADDGQVIVLGGLIEEQTRLVESKVPFLGDIPGVGYLFRSTSNVSNKAELLIFVTPRILEEGSSIY